MVDLEKFDEFGKEWWNPKGRLRSLHKINPLRFGYFKDKIKDLKGLKVLDVGCGGGLLSEEFAREGTIVTGIDLSPVSLDAARLHANESGLKIDYRLCSPGDMADEKEEYGAVICAEVLEHVDDLEGFVRDCAGLLRSGGYFFFSTLNKTLSSRFFAIFIAEDIFGMVPRGTHDYNKFIKPSTLTNILKENSIVVKDLKGLTFELWTLGFKLSQNLSVNYLGYGVKE